MRAAPAEAPGIPDASRRSCVTKIQTPYRKRHAKNRRQSGIFAYCPHKPYVLNYLKSLLATARNPGQ